MKKVLFVILAVLGTLSVSAQPLSGTYTIGGTNPIFATFAAAAAALASSGVSGPVTFNVRAGVYKQNGGLDPVLSLTDTVVGISAVNRITFQPDAASGATVDNVILTRSTPSDVSGIVKLYLDHVTLRELSIIDSSTTTTSSYACIHISPGPVFGAIPDSVHIIGCRITGNGAIGSARTFLGILTTGPRCRGVEVRSNIITGVVTGIQLDAFAFQYSLRPIIVDNVILRPTSQVSAFQGYGISLDGTDSSLVSGNLIDYEGTGGGAIGIRVANGIGAYVEKNIVRNRIDIGDPNGTTFYGFYLYVTSGRLVNNMISGVRGRNTAGITLVSCSDLEVYHNSVFLPPGQGADFTVSICLEIGNNSTNVSVVNNILVDLTTSGLASALWLTGSSPASDYNTLAAPFGSFLVHQNGISYANLLAWQGTGQDLNSVSKTPLVLDQITDLHLSGCSREDPDLRGTAVDDVDGDIDGNLRNTASPSMGADEAIPAPHYFDNAYIIPDEYVAYTVAAERFDNIIYNGLAIAYSGSNTIKLMHNLGDGTFEQRGTINTFINPSLVRFAHMDNDGNFDLVVVGEAYTALVYWGDGVGGFSVPTEIATSNRPRQFELGDIDNDGNMDIVMTQDYGFASTAGHLQAFLNLGNHIFLAQTPSDTTFKPTDLVLRDFDGDNDPDVMALNLLTYDMSFYRNNGVSGTQWQGFAPSVDYNVSAVSGGIASAIADGNFDGDGDIDLAVIEFPGADNLIIVENDGNGGFSSQRLVSALGSEPLSITALDIEDDGDVDLVTANILLQDHGISIYLNDGVGNFTNIDACNGFGIRGAPDHLQSAYIDENSLLDLTVTAGDTVYILYNFSDMITGIEDQPAAQISQYRLSQNYPNPFNPATAIRYQLPVLGFVELTVFDILGRAVAILVNEDQTAGEHVAHWNGKNATGFDASSGVYFYRLEVKGIDTKEVFTSVRKMLFLK